jgi:hypothetical protein
VEITRKHGFTSQTTVIILENISSDDNIERHVWKAVLMGRADGSRGEQV